MLFVLLILLMFLVFFLFLVFLSRSLLLTLRLLTGGLRRLLLFLLLLGAFFLALRIRVLLDFFHLFPRLLLGTLLFTISILLPFGSFLPSFSFLLRVLRFILALIR